MAKKNLYYLVHKPYKVLSQFSAENGNPGLGSLYDLAKDVYPVGRLDLDSEGLLLLTNDKSLNNKLLNPSFNHKRTYLVEVDGQPDRTAISALQEGVTINVNGKRYKTKKARVVIVHPEVPERKPAVNYKKHPVRTWVELTLTEGKNRQVRRMTAAVGHPTLRLIRIAIEDLKLNPLKSGEIKQISKKALYDKLNIDSVRKTF